MAERQVDEKTRTVELEHIEAFRFRVSFGGGIPDVFADEPQPLGKGSGPDAARLLAAAVGDCLSASLCLCLEKSRVPLRSMNTTVTMRIARNDLGRLRVTRGDVRMIIDTDQETARIERCLHMFEDYCIVTATIRQAFPVDVIVADSSGIELYHSGTEVAVASP